MMRQQPSRTNYDSGCQAEADNQVVPSNFHQMLTAWINFLSLSISIISLTQKNLVVLVAGFDCRQMWHTTSMPSFSRKQIIITSILAALLYWSWPIGFWLNPAVAQSSLASQLEASGQPFSWLFVALDVAAGFLVLLVGLSWLFGHGRRRAQRLVGLGLAGFGSLVMTAALTPLNCDPSVNSCRPLWHYPDLVVHGLASIIGSLALLLAIVVVTYDAIAKVKSLRLGGVMMLMLAGWIASGVASLVLIALHRHTNLTQYYFITITSLSIPVAVAAGLRLWDPD